MSHELPPKGQRDFFCAVDKMTSVRSPRVVLGGARADIARLYRSVPWRGPHHDGLCYGNGVISHGHGCKSQSYEYYSK